ncbi:uncharacterized protein LOC105790323 isoform X2 [Gossypium raimondii]|uniref:uncharacterized protein LOC105790323 isoform X2 n=1 Tax=Gossypium raimondii TaxID=29730 RepID=UPI00227B9184|nr:uncharacterized protein LOC105790323 isoform X2 [Gossypium raimondii]
MMVHLHSLSITSEKNFLFCTNISRKLLLKSICKVYCCQKNCLQRRPKSRNSFSFVLPQLISPLPQLSASKLELLSLSVIDCLQGKKKSRSRMVLLRGKTWLCLLCLQWGKSRSVLSKTLVLSSFKFIYCKS